MVPAKAAAQTPTSTKFKFITTFSTHGVLAPECTQEVAVVVPILNTYPAPADWTWILVCDEAAWHRLEMHTGQANVAGMTVGMTDRHNHLTYIRGYTVLHPSSDDPDAQPRHIIAHELGHILADTSDENKAEKKAQELLKSVSVVVAAVTP
jgi:hypothetical protein